MAILALLVASAAWIHSNHIAGATNSFLAPPGSSSRSIKLDISSIRTHPVVEAHAWERHGFKKAVSPGQAKPMNAPDESQFQIFGIQPPSLRMYLIDVVATWVVWLAFALATYFCCYRPLSTLPEKKPEAQVDSAALEELFNSGHWRCLDDSNICFFSFCCPSLRWSDNISLAGFLGFFAALVAFSFMVLLNEASDFAAYGIFTAILIMYYRQQLRQKLGIQSGTFQTCCTDFCFACWCPCCAIAQEANIVHKAVQMGHNEFTPVTS